MRLINFYFLLFSFIYNNRVFSQELNAQIIVNSNLVNQTNQQIFETLEKSINEFVNNQSWTNKEFLNNEKITCSFVFTLSSYKMINNYAEFINGKVFTKNDVQKILDENKIIGQIINVRFYNYK